MIRRVLIAALAMFALPACGGGDTGVAVRNPVFYDNTTIGGDLGSKFETPYPPLDLSEHKPNPPYRGVEILDRKVRISRPANWIVRAASDRPGDRYIQYLSPREYVFSVYERQELPDARWSDVVARYEKSLEANKAEVLHEGVPMATFNGQGRAYLVRRRVPAAKAPFINVSREYLIRADNRIVLVQIVHPVDGQAPISGELRRVIDTLELR
ncbi:MAG: hypothetical protein CVU63_03785 [Deltaproteobacteria bacterium HGW-Deltaproteobacteria-20]|nr:MAG: hypothetical protein CVU63_03785 [Deltaproteobacteria bacterium HGW-Deltaproteobacteria-20]